MLIRHTFLYLPAQILGPLTQFVAAIVWTHWLLPEAYGVLAYVMAAQELTSVICLSWWSHYTLRFVGGFASDADRQRYQHAENTILLLTSLLQAIVGVAALAAQEIPLTPDMVAVTVLYCISRSVTSHLGERARASGRIGLYTMAQTAGPVLGFALAFAFVSRVAATPEAALTGFALAQFAGLVWLWRSMGLGLRVARPEGEILSRALAFGVPLVLAGAIAWVSTNGIRVIVEYVEGQQAVGLVSVGWALGQRLASVVAMLVTAAAFPLAVRHLQAGSRDLALRQLSLSGAVLFALIAPAAAGIIVLARPAVELMIATPFQEVTMAVLPLAAVGGAVRNLRTHFSDQVLILFEHTGLCALLNTAEALATVVCCYIGLSVGGLTGAAAGCVAGFLIGATLGFAVAVGRFGLVVLWADLARIALATALMCGIILLVPAQRIGGGPGGLIAVDVAVGVCVYGACLAALFPHLLRSGLLRLRRPRSAIP